MTAVGEEVGDVDGASLDQTAGRELSELYRYEGAQSLLGTWFSRLRQAERAGDATARGEASAVLARLLVARGTELELAITLATDALSVRDDLGLRTELAAWTAGLGEPARAAEILLANTETDPATRQKLLLRAGVLWARAGRPSDAATAFETAHEVAPTAPMPLELLGTLAAWADPTISRARGSNAYLQAAELRQQQGQEDAALEDLLRAHELDPSAGAPVKRLAALLEGMGRVLAADEVLRSFGQRHRKLSSRTIAERGAGTDWQGIHFARLSHALDRGFLDIALSAALDVGLSGNHSNILEVRLDELLTRLGLFELVAMRATRRLASAPSERRTEMLLSLGQLYAGSLGDRERAETCYARALKYDPSSERAKEGLGDPRAEAAWVEGLTVAIAEPPSDQSWARARLARQLFEWEAKTERDPALGAWALSRESAHDPGTSDEVALALARLEPRLAHRALQIQNAEADLETPGAARDARLDKLRQLSELYGRSPAFEERRFSTLAAVCRADHADGASFDELDRLFSRAPHDLTRRELFVRLLRERCEAELDVRSFVRLAELLDLSAALTRLLPIEALMPLLDAELAEERDRERALGALLVYANWEEPSRDLARILAQFSEALPPALGAVALAASADTYRLCEAFAEARRESERALGRDPNSVRAAAALAEIAASTGGQDAALAIEKALGVIVPMAWLCNALAKNLEAIGEQDLAFAWNQRWLSLAPGDRNAVGELLRRCEQCAEPRRLAETLNWVLAQPDPPGDRARPFMEALALLFGLEKDPAGQVARRALDVFGPKEGFVRDQLLSFADQFDDAGLAILVLERVLVVDGPKVSTLVELSVRRVAVEDFDGAARELLRACSTVAKLENPAEDFEDLLANLSELERDSAGRLGADGIVALAEGRALCLAHVRRPPEVKREAWLHLAAVRWDLCGDAEGAEESLYRATEEGGSVTDFAAHVTELLPNEQAEESLTRRAAELERADRSAAAGLWLRGAEVASIHDRPDASVRYAAKVLAIENSAEAIAILESHADLVGGGYDALDIAYRKMSERALGKFGRRAAHYRAARRFERGGQTERALTHAILCFEAVPNEGTSWSLLSRLVDPAAGSSEAVELFERLGADAAGEERATWYRHAIELSGTTTEGLDRRMTLALKAVLMTSGHAFARTLFDVVDQLEARGELSPIAADRIHKATLALKGRSEGPDGARLLGLMGRVLARVGSIDEAFDALRAVLAQDPSTEIWSALRDVLPALAADPQRAHKFLGELDSRARGAGAEVPLLTFGAELAAALGDEASASAFRDAARVKADEEAAAVPVFDLAPDLFADDPEFGADQNERATPDRAAGNEASVEGAHDSNDSNDPRDVEGESAAAESAQPKDSSPAPDVAGPRSADEPEPLGGLGAASGADHGLTMEADPGDAFAVARELRDFLAEPGPTPSQGARSRGRRQSPSAEFSLVKDGFDALMVEAPASERPQAAGAPVDRDAPPGVTPPQGSERDAQGDNEADAADPAKASAEGPTDPAEDPEENPQGDPAEDLSEDLDETLRARETEIIRAIADGDRHGAAKLLSSWLKADGAGPLYVPTAELGVECLLGAGDAGLAAQVLANLPRDRAEILELRRMTFARLGDPKAELAAADELAKFHDEGLAAGHALVLGAKLALASGDPSGAASRASRGLKLSASEPGGASSALEALRILYLLRGMGTPREAQAVIEHLLALPETLAPADIELRAFLLAEATDVIHGGGAGLRELTLRHAEVGPLPLIALGMGERLLRGRSFEAALPLLRKASAADVRGLRSVASICLAALDAAIQSEDRTAALELLAECEGLADARTHLERRRRELDAQDPDPEVAKPVLVALAQESSGGAKARHLLRLARIVVHEEPNQALGIYEEALALARRDRPLSDTIRAELIELIETQGGFQKETMPAPALRRSEGLPPDLEPPVSSGRPILELSDADESAWVDDDAEGDDTVAPENPWEAADAQTAEEDPEASLSPSWVEALDHTPDAATEAPVATPPAPPLASSSLGIATSTNASPPTSSQTTAEQPAPGGLSSAQPSARPPRLSLHPDIASVLPQIRPDLETAEEGALFRALMKGDASAGDRLVDGYGDLIGRGRDVLIVRRIQAALEPWDRVRLMALQEAARIERDELYVRAVEHLINGPPHATLVAPALASQPSEPVFTSQLLLGDIQNREIAVLKIIWEAGLHRRELARYDMTADDRLSLSKNALGRAFAELVGRVGASRALFYKHRASAPDVTVGLLSQPVVLVYGDVRETSPTLLYRLAAAHISAEPEFLLAAHLDEVTLKRLFLAVDAAFGPVKTYDELPPPSVSDVFQSDVAKVTAELWQRLTPKAERLLREACADGPLDPALARVAAGQAMRRAGMFATGDVWLTLRMLALEFGLPMNTFEGEGGPRMIKDYPEAVDLMRLASRLEFAECRWQRPLSERA